MIFCGHCNNPISEYEPFCPSCKTGNPSYLNALPKDQPTDAGPRTRFERILASELKKKGIAFQSNPLIRLSACIRYTPDFLIRRKLIVEVDGGIHDRDYRQTPDRIRQRALEKLGFSVYRIRNEVIEESPQTVTEEILQQYYQAFDAQLGASRSVLSEVTKLENRE